MPKYQFQCFVKIGGTDVSDEMMQNLVEIVVDSSLHLPDMFTIQIFENPSELKWVDDARLDIGKEVEISIKTPSEYGYTVTETLIKGEITALEPHFRADGLTTMSVRGYDKSHRLHRGKKTQTFMTVKDSDLPAKVAGNAGLSPDADTTTVTYDWILQNNQTDMEFLLARAERIGYQVFASDGKLHFKKGDFTLGDGPQLTFGDNLTSFRPCWTAAHQTDKMVVKGWDPKGKQAITSEKTPPGSLNQGGMTQTGGDIAKSGFGTAKAVVVDQPVFTADEATAMAEGLSYDINREFVEAEGVCLGDPRIKAGWKVEIKNVGDRFAGKYFVTSATHVITPGGHETTFSITGRHPNTLSHLLASGNGHDQSRGLVRGVVTGMVTNLNDPDDLGRVKVKYPWLGTEIESDWVRLAAPMAGPERGTLYLPEVNDEVLIAFEHGDVHHPYMIGALWSSTDKPPRPNSEAVGGDGKVNLRVLKTRQGHEIVLDDTADAEKITITSKSGHVVELDDASGSEKIKIVDKTGKNDMVIDSAKNSMAINVDGDFSVTAKGKITLNSTGNMTLDAKGNLDAKAAGNGTVKGTQLTLEGTAKGELKAATVSVSGSAMTEVKGGLVKIN